MPSYTECPCCSDKRMKPVEAHPGIYSCGACDAIFGDCYLGDSYAIVHPQWADPNTPTEQTRYFDFMCVGSTGVTRRHGWYDRATRRIVQTG